MPKVSLIQWVSDRLSETRGQRLVRKPNGLSFVGQLYEPVIVPTRIEDDDVARVIYRISAIWRGHLGEGDVDLLGKAGKRLARPKHTQKAVGEDGRVTPGRIAAGTRHSLQHRPAEENAAQD